MSSQQNDKWTTLTVHKSVLETLERFCDTYDISSKGKGIGSLLTIAETAGVPLSQSDPSEEARDLDLNEIESIQGFLLDDGGGGAVVVGTDSNRVQVITDVSEAQSAVQPMDRTKITHGSVICPACGETLMQYELSDSLPGVETGVFNGLTVTCQTCGEQRPHYTLFVAKPEADVPVDAMADVMKSYIAYLLVVETTLMDEFEERVDACSTLASDGGWDWLPDPSKWIGFSIEELGVEPISTEMYCEFLQSYLRLLVDREDGVRVMEVEVFPPEQSDDPFTEQWQVQVETRGSDPSDGVEAFLAVTDSWEEVSVTAEEIDADTFADNTVIVTLDGLERVES